MELDDSQHYEPDEKSKDAIRTAYFESFGIHVLRFSNADVDRQFNSVCEEILYTLEKCDVAAEIVLDEGEK